MRNLAAVLLALVSWTLIDTTDAWAQRVPTARITPLPAAEWTDAHKEALGTRARGEETLDVFQTCLRNVELCRTWMPFTNYILSDRLSIPARERELLILRAGYLCNSDYEWAQHAPLGLRVGLTDAEIARIPKGPDAPGVQWIPLVQSRAGTSPRSRRASPAPDAILLP